MSFIRTKNGIYELKENGIGQTPTSIQISIITGEYLQADTIKELIDEFVVVDVNSYWTYQALKFDLEQLKESFDNVIIYGAIWIKGENGEPILKSVAKMNEEGNLELL